MTGCCLMISFRRFASLPPRRISSEPTFSVLESVESDLFHASQIFIAIQDIELMLFGVKPLILQLIGTSETFEKM